MLIPLDRGEAGCVQIGKDWWDEPGENRGGGGGGVRGGGGCSIGDLTGGALIVWRNIIISVAFDGVLRASYERQMGGRPPSIYLYLYLPGLPPAEREGTLLSWCSPILDGAH